MSQLSISQLFGVFISLSGSCRLRSSRKVQQPSVFELEFSFISCFCGLRPKLFKSKQFFAISCINVGVGPGGTTSMLARIAIVDYRGQTVLDTYVAPTMEVTDYRTATTGIEPAHLSGRNAVPFNAIQQHVASIIKGQILVGHSLWNDLSVLGIPHPAVNTRDVALYQPFRNALRSPNHIVGLQTLAWQLMCRRCQEGEQNPLENARACMDLYRSDPEWENTIRQGLWPSQLPPSSFSRCYV